jgi:uncharacterized protein
MKVVCPSCKESAEYSRENPHRPFCSARCRQIDLGAWATESYRLPVVDSKDDDLGESLTPDLH